MVPPRWLSACLADISPVADALTASMVYYPGGWDDVIPKEMLKRVVEQRLKLVEAGAWDRATDAEVAGYLSTASLCFPLSHNMTEIFIYEVWRTLPELNWKEVLHVPEELTQNQQYELDELKFKIRNSQIKHRGDTIVRKIVIEEHGPDKIMVGITKDKCDPVIETVASLEVAFTTLPLLIATAEKRWAETPLNPKFEAPKSAKPVAAAAPATPPKTSGRRKKGEQAVQSVLGAQPAKEEPKTTTAPDGGAQPAQSSAPIAEPLPLLSEEKSAQPPAAAAPSVSASDVTVHEDVPYKGYLIRFEGGNNTWYVEKDGNMLTYDHPSVADAKLAIDQKEPADSAEARNEQAIKAMGIQAPAKSANVWDTKPGAKGDTTTWAEEVERAKATREKVEAESPVEILGAKLGSEPGVPVPETTPAASGENSENAGAVPGKKPRAPRTVKSDVEYFLADGTGPFATVQLALDALGVPVGPGRPTHNRYDRLGKKDWQLKIIEKPKATAEPQPPAQVQP